MTDDQIRTVVLRTLGTIVPEADFVRLMPGVPLRDQLDMDSMDFLNFVIGLHGELNVEIPETDYRELSTLDGCVAYLKRTRGKAQQSAQS